MDKRILAFVTGTLDAKSFIKDIKEDPVLQSEIRALIPEEAKGDPSHPLWKVVSYGAYSKNNFDILRILQRHALDGRVGGNLNLFGTLSGFVSFQYPELPLTRIYYDRHDIFLRAAGDCFEGPEVRSVVESILEKALQQPTKKAQLSMAKQLINEQFHIGEGKRPRWIQGGEWPMGKNSPMVFVESKRVRDGKVFSFRDADTGESREIIQYY